MVPTSPQASLEILPRIKSLADFDRILTKTLKVETPPNLKTPGMQPRGGRVALFLVALAAVAILPGDGAPGSSARGGGSADWFEVEVTLAHSDFADGDDGWEVIGEARDLRAESAAISALDEGSHLWFFSAPPKYLGDVRESFGCRLSYSLGHYHSDSAGRQPTMVEDVVLISDLHNMTLLRSGVIKPWTYTSNVEVQLDGSGRWTHAITGDTASDDDLRQALSALSGLLVRGGYYHGKETTWLKDVQMGRKQRVNRANPAERAPSMRAEDVPVPPSLSYTTSLDDDIRMPPPPRASRPRPAPREPAAEELSAGDVVSRALYDDVNDVKEELERSDQQLRGVVAQLQVCVCVCVCVCV